MKKLLSLLTIAFLAISLSVCEAGKYGSSSSFSSGSRSSFSSGSSYKSYSSSSSSYKSSGSTWGSSSSSSSTYKSSPSSSGWSGSSSSTKSPSSVSSYSSSTAPKYSTFSSGGKSYTYSGARPTTGTINVHNYSYYNDNSYRYGWGGYGYGGYHYGMGYMFGWYPYNPYCWSLSSGEESWYRYYSAATQNQIMGRVGKKIPNSDFTRHWVEYLITDRVTGSETIERVYLN